MKTLTLKYKFYLTDRRFILSLSTGIILVLASLVVNFYAGMYATEKASNFVTDLILDNIPVYNVNGVFVYGPLILWLFVLALCLAEPKRGPFVLKNIALFILIRSMFITLTHIGPFPERSVVNYSSDLVKKFTFGGDLFFSAHTGLPFLMALVFYKNIILRILFVATSIFFGAVVLMGHLHYSIDVMSAFFVTFSIYHMAKVIFKKDSNLFDSTKIELDV